MKQMTRSCSRRFFHLRKRQGVGVAVTVVMGKTKRSSLDVSRRGSIPRGSIPRGSIPRGSIPRGSIPRGNQ